MMRVSSNRRSPLQAGQTRMLRSSSSIMPSSPAAPGSAAHLLAKPFERQPQSLVGVDPGLPAEGGAGPSDVRLPDLGVVLRKGVEDDLAPGGGQPDDAL